MRVAALGRLVDVTRTLDVLARVMLETGRLGEEVAVVCTRRSESSGIQLRALDAGRPNSCRIARKSSANRGGLTTQHT